ncbi:MAG: hypothetical protein WCW61_00355 [Patescibacteria group bacterium]|jgi:hypothetical protein
MKKKNLLTALQTTVSVSGTFGEKRSEKGNVATGFDSSGQQSSNMQQRK